MADNETFGSKLVAIRKSMKSADIFVRDFLKIYGGQFITAAELGRYGITMLESDIDAKMRTRFTIVSYEELKRAFAAEDIRFDIYVSPGYAGKDKRTYDFSWG